MPNLKLSPCGVPNFSTSQTVGLPNKINFLDTSTGSDVTIVGRVIFMQLYDGSYIVQDGTTTDYELWPIADSTITLNVLEQDQAVNIIVNWVDINGDTVETKTILTGFTLYDETFDYGLTQMLAGNPLLINDNRFFYNKSKLRVYLDSGNNAITLASDITSAQLCYDEATLLRINSPYTFNLN